MKKISIMKLSGVILLTCAGLASANLLTNGDFEQAGVGGAEDAAGWFQTNPFVVTPVADVNPPGHGDFTMLIQDNDAAFHWASQKVAATAGQEYTASAEFKAKLNAGEAAWVLIDWFDAADNVVGSFELSDDYAVGDGDYADFAWVTRSVTAVAPATTTQIGIRLFTSLDGQGDSGVWADNADIVAIPEPATMGLFGLMGGAMLWARKRFRA